MADEVKKEEEVKEQEKKPEIKEEIKKEEIKEETKTSETAKVTEASKTEEVIKEDNKQIKKEGSEENQEKEDLWDLDKIEKEIKAQREKDKAIWQKENQAKTEKKASIPKESFGLKARIFYIHFKEGVSSTKDFLKVNLKYFIFILILIVVVYFLAGFFSKNKPINMNLDEELGDNLTEEIENVSLESNETECLEQWECGNWSLCINNSLTRNCTDLNECKTDKTKPEITQECQVRNCGNENCSIEEKCVSEKCQPKTCAERGGEICTSDRFCNKGEVMVISETFIDYVSASATKICCLGECVKGDIYLGSLLNILGNFQGNVTLQFDSHNTFSSGDIRQLKMKSIRNVEYELYVNYELYKSGNLTNDLGDSLFGAKNSIVNIWVCEGCLADISNRNYSVIIDPKNYLNETNEANNEIKGVLSY
jgi:hypothetical protein